MSWRGSRYARCRWSGGWFADQDIASDRTGGRLTLRINALTGHILHPGAAKLNRKAKVAGGVHRRRTDDLTTQ